MEDSVFPSPAVAELMKKGFVEARLHVDTQKNLTKEQFARNREFQKQMTASRGMPVFVVVDPKTGKKLGETPPVGYTSSAFTENWIKFLREMNSAAGRQ
jgi:thioredoxin-related protein